MTFWNYETRIDFSHFRTKMHIIVGEHRKSVVVFFCINGTFKLWGWIVCYGQIPNQQPLSSLEQRLHIYKFLMKSAYEPRWARLSACVNKSIAQVRCCDPHPPTTGTWRRKRRKKNNTAARITQSHGIASQVCSGNLQQSAATLTNTLLQSSVMNQQIGVLHVSSATQPHCTGNWTVGIDQTSEFCSLGLKRKSG